MEKLGRLKPLMSKKKSQPHPLSKPGGGYSENILTPVTLSGVVVPWREILDGGTSSDFKLVCASGIEYFIVADGHWRTVLSQYCWEDVEVKGLLNASNRTIIPQMVFPKGSSGERESVIDFAAWKGRELAQKFKAVNDLILVPTAILTMMMF